MLAAAKNHNRFSEIDFLVCVKETNIRILINAGASIRETDNSTMVQSWLAKVYEAQAAVYFGAYNEAWAQ
jgi:hypothetical protein